MACESRERSPCWRTLQQSQDDRKRLFRSMTFIIDGAFDVLGNGALPSQRTGLLVVTPSWRPGRALDAETA